MVELTQAVLLGEFFGLILRDSEGYFCIATASQNDPRGTFRDEFFKWPSQRKQILEYIDIQKAGRHVWYCPHLLSKPQRRKEYAIDCASVWADLDEADPELIEPTPPILTRTSPGRFQAIWPLESPVPARVAEDFNRRLAYKYKDLGVDLSGWDLTQLLRVPLTTNYKYPGYPLVEIVRGNPVKVPLEIFSAIPTVNGIALEHETQIPEDVPDPDDVVAKNRGKIPPEFYVARDKEPGLDDDWSRKLWRFLIMCFEAGLTAVEVFSVAQDAACNKYRRDNRPPLDLWHDVIRAQETVRATKAIISGHKGDISLPGLATEEEFSALEPTFVERYIDWAAKMGDAAKQYHEAGAFVILSSLLSGNLRVDSNIGLIVPNLWFMILADTTLTRKTTAMDRAMDLLEEVETDSVLATDGSVEGLMQALSGRPRRPSVFLRDEVTGLVEAMVRKDYMAGMLETLTKLYDARSLKRVLRKEEINVRDPILIIFSGGIKNRMEAILQDEHVTSGFLPRFLIISAESSVESIQPLGPRDVVNSFERESLRQELAILKENYTVPSPEISVAGHTIVAPPEIQAKLTDEAWERYNSIYFSLISSAVETSRPEIYTPVFDRFSNSILKMSVLIAASRQQPNDERVITVDLQDIVRAAYYGDKWIPYTLGVIGNIGNTTVERVLDRITQYVKNNPGVSRSALMRNFKLSSFETDNVLRTLEQRSLIMVNKVGKGYTIYPED